MQTQITIQLTVEELSALIEKHVRNAMNDRRDFESQFQDLPPILRQQAIANFLGKDISTVKRWSQSGKLQFMYEPGKRPYITKGQFIEDCRKNNLL